VGRRSVNGGVGAKGADRIEFTFTFEGVRYRPTIKRIPSEANLRRARKQLEEIKVRIANGTFSFAQEFPEYRYMKELGADARGARTCDEVFDEFMTHCESRMSKNDLAFATLDSYRKILDAVWRPKIGEEMFEKIKYSTLVKTADAMKLAKKTYNNIISPLRCAFEYGYRDHPEKHNPATGLKGFRITKKDRPVIDPFTIPEAEAVIEALREDWGDAQANYDEFRFFTGLRPSEQIALLVSDCDVSQRKINVTKARVLSRDKDRTKTSEDRLVELCPRALEILNRQLALRARMKLAGKIDHEELFFKEDGTPIRNLQYPWVRWRRTLERLKARYREPYNARHSSVSWNLMIGKNPLWVAKQHGHSVQTMLEVYATWTEGATESDIEAIKHAMEVAPRASRSANTTGVSPLQSPGIRHQNATTEGSERRKCSHHKRILWRRERDSNPRRAFDPYTLSRGAPSTTRPSLRFALNSSEESAT
jgi:integrase